MADEKQKIEVTIIHLGLEPKIPDGICPETIEETNKLIDTATIERELLRKIVLRPEQTKMAYDLLLAKHQETKGDPKTNYLTAELILNEIQTKNLSTLIQALNNYLIKLGKIHTLKKRTIKGVRVYSLEIAT